MSNSLPPKVPVPARFLFWKWFFNCAWSMRGHRYQRVWEGMTRDEFMSNDSHYCYVCGSRIHFTVMKF